MNLKSIATILVLAAASVCAQAQQSTPAKPTKEDTQKVFKVISSDKAKLQTFCDIAKLGDEMEKANEKRELQEIRGTVSERGRIGKKTGHRICHLDGRDSECGPTVRGWSGDQFDDAGARQVVPAVRESPLWAIPDIAQFIQSPRRRERSAMAAR